MEMTINLPDKFDIESRGVVVTVNPTEIPADLVAQIVLHGLKQKVADSASGAVGDAYESAHEGKKWKDLSDAQRAKFAEANKDAVESTTRAQMQATWDAVKAGEWSKRGEGIGGFGHGALDGFILSALRDVAKHTVGETAYKKLGTETKRRELCKQLWDAMTGEHRASVVESATEARDAAEAAAKKLAGVKVEGFKF